MMLTDLKIGEKARIVCMTSGGEKAYRQKLLSLGLTPGTELKIERRAPWGDPVEIAVRGYALSLRLKEAHILKVERI